MRPVATATAVLAMPTGLAVALLAHLPAVAPMTAQAHPDPPDQDSAANQVVRRAGIAVPSPLAITAGNAINKLSLRPVR